MKTNNGYALRQLAEALATVVHDGQFRKGAGEPYIEHPRRVAASMRLWGWRQQTIAWLHDVIEDAADPEKMDRALVTIFPRDIVDAVRWLSRLPDADGAKEPYQEWIEAIAACPDRDVALVKLADLEDNLRDIRDTPPEMRGIERRYTRARSTLLAALDPAAEEE